MSAPLFPGSRVAHLRNYDLEVVPSGLRRHRDLVDTLRADVLEIATRSRGWDDDASRDEMARHFKLGPLYEASAVALLREQGRLVGIAGTVNDWEVEEGSIVHLCSVGFMPSVQGQRLMPVLMGLLWAVSLQDERLRRSYANGRLFVTAITQSPFLITYLGALFDAQPSPYRPVIDPVAAQIARRVVDRFDPELTLDPETLTLKDECRFFYRRLPYGPDPRVNAFCNESLRYDRGDVFVVVGRADPARIDPILAAAAQANAKLFADLGLAVAQPEEGGS